MGFLVCALHGHDRVWEINATQPAWHEESPVFIIKLIFAFLLPPVTAYLQVGVTTHFWINIALTLLGGIPGVLHALWLIFTDQTE